MFKKILATAAIMLSMVGAASASTLAEVRDATFMLFSDGRPICSGTMVKNSNDETRFLTAAHCVEQDKTPTITRVTLDDELRVIRTNTYVLELVKQDTPNDVAIYKVLDPKASFITADVATNSEASMLRLGEDLINSHYPISSGYLGHVFTPGIYNGIIRAPSEWKGEDFVYLTTTQSVKGSSGGGLYAEFFDCTDDLTVCVSEWKLIGTVEGGPQTVDFLNMFSTTDSVVGILTEE